MKNSGISIGFIEEIIRKNGNFTKAWFRTPQINNKLFFNFKALNIVSQASQIKKGVFITFEAGERSIIQGIKSATTIKILSKAQIAKELLSYDNEDVVFIIENTEGDFTSKLIDKLNKVSDESPISEIQNKIETIKQRLPEQFIPQIVEGGLEKEQAHKSI